jgi:hypothetical protein
LLLLLVVVVTHVCLFPSLMLFPGTCSRGMPGARCPCCLIGKGAPRCEVSPDGHVPAGLWARGRAPCSRCRLRVIAPRWLRRSASSPIPRVTVRTCREPPSPTEPKTGEQASCQARWHSGPQTRPGARSSRRRDATPGGSGTSSLNPSRDWFSPPSAQASRARLG